MKHWKKPVCALLSVLLLVLSGCYSGNIDQYFSLPQPAEEHLQLQSLIDQEISSGSEYAAPTGGSFRRSVQFFDLDGDDMDEAIAFFRDADKTLRIIVYTAVGSEYRKVLTVSGEGRSIGSVAYSDVDADGRQDLIVAWQISGRMNLLSVYSLVNWSGDLLLSTDSTEFIIGDLNADGHDELLVLRSVGSDMHMADMYTFNAQREPQATSAALSQGIYELRRARLITLSDLSPALLVESALESGDLVTDVFVCREGSLIDLTLNRSTGISEARRSYSLIYSQDIDSDGVTEIPHPQQLYAQTSEIFWAIAWYRYDAYGRASAALTTYHCFSDGWYLVLPRGWEVGLTVRRDDSVPSERKVILSQVGTDGVIHDLLAVYTITGENRNERSRLGSRFPVLEDTATVYAMEILGPGIDRNTIQARLFRIYSEWGGGAV